MRVFFLTIILMLNPASSAFELEFLEELTGEFEDVEEDVDLKTKAMLDEAFTIGAQSGYLQQMRWLEKEIEKKKHQLDSIFDFSAIIRQINQPENHQFLVPPSVEESENHINVSSSGNILTTTGREFSIIKEAHLSPTPPDWRSFLFVELAALEEPKLPHPSLLPVFFDEREAWKNNVREGWVAGIKNANQEMKHRIRALDREFNGILKYAILIEKGLVKAPKVSRVAENVIAQGKSLSIQRNHYQIDLGAEFNPETSTWTFRHDDTL